MRSTIRALSESFALNWTPGSDAFAQKERTALRPFCVGVFQAKKSKLRTNGPMRSRSDCFPECLSAVSTMKHLRYFSL